MKENLRKVSEYSQNLASYRFKPGISKIQMQSLTTALKSVSDKSNPDVNKEERK
jgi:hypothetical protein